VPVKVRALESPGSLDDFETDRLRQALVWPRGQYTYTRASQLTGVPERTLHHWAKQGYLIPDFDDFRPKLWSYRDLVFLRMIAWLRVKGMQPSRVIQHVRQVRKLAEDGDLKIGVIRSQGRSVLLEGENVDRLSAEIVFPELTEFLPEFDLMAPIGINDFHGKIWGPNLVRPSRRTSLSPWVMSGEPCLTGTRIPTSTIFALRSDRDLQPEQIVTLYPGTDLEAIRDAIDLESRLRGLAQAA
jgi:uncharacterized protein (DUF433 family)